jgi:hypothetical protein
MDDKELLAYLHALTGDLEPGGANAEDLHSLRRRLAASLRDSPARAIPESASLTAESCLHTQLKLAIAESPAEELPEGSRLFLVRRQIPLNLPVLAADAAHPLAGQAPARTFGPFEDTLQRPVWFDEFVVGPTLHIGWAGRPEIALVLPAAVVLAGTRKLQYAECSVWVAAGSLAHSAAAGAYAGWKVRQATVEFSAAGAVSGQKLTLPANATCHLTMTPDNSEAPEPPSNAGATASEAVVERPNHAEFFFNANGITTINAASAGVTVFGNTTSLVRTNDAPVWDDFLGRVLIPFQSSPAPLDAVVSKTTLCNLSGQGNITAGAWSPIPSRAAPDQLGDAGSGGSIVLTVAGEFKADSSLIERGPLRLGKSYIYADKGTVGWFAPLVSNLRSSCPISLWQRSALRVAFDEVFPFYFLSSRLGLDSLQLRGTLTASLSQPTQADGSSLPVRFPRAVISFLHAVGGITAFGGASDPQLRGRTALALSNGLFTLTPAMQFSFNLKMSAAALAGSGTVELQFGIYQLLPMLPDPYAANFGPDRQADAPRGRLRLKISFTGAEPRLSFTAENNPRAGGEPEIVPRPSDTPLANASAETMRTGFYNFLDQFQRKAVRSSPRNLRLLDVSTGSDQLGVNLSFRPGADGSIQAAGVDLVSFGGGIEVLMLPQFQWEPVHVLKNLNVGTFPNVIMFPDDGGPTLIGARAVRLTPVAPLPVAAAVIDAYNRDAQPAAAFFTLPFGIRAAAVLDPHPPFPGLPAGLGLRRLEFDDQFTAATQVRVQAAPPVWAIRAEKGQLVRFLQLPAKLPGVAMQLAECDDPHQTGIKITPPPPPSPPSPPPPPPKTIRPYSVLDPLDRAFNSTFSASESKQVPIDFVDLSGYGASCFSDWQNDSGGTGISNVRFETLNGRTRYEMIRMRSRLIPCDAVVVRTITLERRASGAVHRWDSGWVAVTDGLFEWKTSDVVFHTGAVQGFYNIREIRDTRTPVPLAEGAEVEVVYFDADIAVDQAVRGASSGNRVPALNQLGFVQQIPLPFPASGSPLDVNLLTADQLRELLKKYDPVGGHVDCVVNIGGSGQEMRVTGIFSAVAPPDGPGSPQFAVACYGSPIVPAKAQWSMCRVSGSDVKPVDPQRGVPLVRRGGTKAPASGNYRIAEPSDLLTTSPATAYGMQLSTDTNRLLFLGPEITPGVRAITGVDSPIMADPYALVGTGGLFPPLARCLHLQIPGGYKLDVQPDGYRWATPGDIHFNIPELPDSKRFVVKGGPFDLRADYAGKKVKIIADSAAPWSINLPQIPSVLDVHTPNLGTDILKIVSDLYSPGALDTEDSQLIFGEALLTAKDIITMLQGFMPGSGVPPLEIKLSPPTQGDPALHLHISLHFPIANEDGAAIDTGIGKFRGELGAGTEIQVGLDGFGGRIYFNVKGELQQPLLPKLLYVGGSLFLEISIDQDGKPTLRLITSAVASIGGDLIPGLIAAEGSASYGYMLDTSGDPFTPGVALGLEIRAKLISGLVGVRFRADVTVGVTFVGEKKALGFARDLLIAGQFTAHLSVVAVYVFEKSFDKTLHFDQTVPGLVAGALMIYTGMAPVPIPV